MSVTVASETLEAGGLEAAAPTPARAVWNRLRRNPVAVASMLTLGMIVLLAVFCPLVSPYSYSLSTNDYSQGVSRRHWLGTNDGGYDTLTLLRCREQRNPLE